jgi:inorganic pyrophosphatase
MRCAMTFEERKRQVKSYLGKTVHIKMDRPIGTEHPKHPGLLYPINYGYIPGVYGGDGEELDVYLLGIDQPVEEYTARIIGIVHRHNDIEDKLVAAPAGMVFTAEEMSKIRTDGNGDRVRLLGTTELAYFDTQEQMTCTPTPYAVANGAWANADTGYCWWWLLSPDNGVHTANYVNSEGKVFTESYETYDADSSVRPVMWVLLDK